VGLEHVDILYLHDSHFPGQHDAETFSSALETLVEFRDQGTVRTIGMGMNQWELAAKMVARFDLDVIMLASRYTLLDQSALPGNVPTP
jgi:D-threo-aldose 1-dehydrogenase